VAGGVIIIASRYCRTSLQTRLNFAGAVTQDPKKDTYVCWPTEGGHTDFPPRDDLEVELHKYLRQRYNQKQRVSVERVISGRSLCHCAHSAYLFAAAILHAQLV
jgi:glucokinase